MLFDFIKFLFSTNNKKENKNHNIIDLIEYHYKVDNVYGNMVFIDLDLDYCDVENGQLVKLLNDIYVVINVEYLPHNTHFKYRMSMIKKDSDIF